MSLRGIKLPLAALQEGKEGNHGEANGNGKDQPSRPSLASYFNESNIHKEIKITFTLPSGDVLEEVVNSGETVQEIKRKLCSASKIPSNSMFFFNGTDMLDPLSLNDIPGVTGNSSLQIVVKVKGQTTPADVISRETTSGRKDTTHTLHPSPLSTTSTSTSTSTHSNNVPTLSSIPTSTTDTNTTDKYEHQPDNKHTSKDTPTSTPTHTEHKPPSENNAETHMYTTGHGRDEKSTTSPHYKGQDPPTPPDTPKKRQDPPDTYQKGHDSPGTKILNFVEPAPLISSSSSSSSPDSTISSLPNAAFDEGEPAIPKSGHEKPRNGHTSETKIDVVDDDSPSHEKRQIQTLGGGKRWFCQVV